MYKSFDEKINYYDGDYHPNSIMDFIEEYAEPIIMNLNSHSATEIFEE